MFPCLFLTGVFTKELSNQECVAVKEDEGNKDSINLISGRVISPFQ